MKLKGKGLNVQVLMESACYLLFGYLMLHLTYSGGYLNYVTPRMKPYLYGLSFLMFLWAAAKGRHLLVPQYRVSLGRSFVLIIPIMLLLTRPAVSGGSSMARNYDSSGISMVSGNGGSQPQTGSGQQVPPSDGGKTKGLPEGEESAPAQSDWDSSETDGYFETGGYQEDAAEWADEYQEDAAERSDEEEQPWDGLNGLDEETKTITIADEDYYAWMYELGSFAEKYEGYTVVMKGFIYRDPEIEKECDFALVRLSMWCCAADLTPIGFFVDCDGKLDYKDDDWVVVKGTFEINADDDSLMLKAQSIEAAEKPEEEYVYPY